MDRQEFFSIIKAHITVGAIVLSADKESLEFSGEARDWAKQNFGGDLFNSSNEEKASIPLWILQDSLSQEEVNELDTALAKAEENRKKASSATSPKAQKLSDFIDDSSNALAQEENNKAFNQFIKTNEIYMNKSGEVCARGSAAFWLKRRLKEKVDLPSEKMEITLQYADLVNLLGKENTKKLFLGLKVIETKQPIINGGFSLS